MRNTCAFIRLVNENEKEMLLKNTINSINNGEFNLVCFIIQPEWFRKVPGSPFAYWINERIRDLFIIFPPFESDERMVRVGMSTTDDFRFLRLWWEVNSRNIVTGNPDTIQEDFIESTFNGKNWVYYAKGGEYSPYYADLHLVVNWKNNGNIIKEWVVNNQSDPGTTHWSRRIANSEYYFRPGLTWSVRTTSEISFRPLISGAIFSHKGPAIITSRNQLLPILGLMESNIFNFLINLLTAAAESAARSYEVGTIQHIPIPNLGEDLCNKIEPFVVDILNSKRRIDTINETSHLFCSPINTIPVGNTIVEMVSKLQLKFDSEGERVTKSQEAIESITYDIYKLDSDDRISIEKFCSHRPPILGSTEYEPIDLVSSLISYLLGCTFGRWDIRYATGEKQPPPLPDPFAPLPPCSPGMLQGEDGLPLSEPPTGYPITIDPDGILVDDPEHPDDIIRKIREVLRVIYTDKAEAIEQEACQILGIRELRDYFRKPGTKGFWDDHIKTYSKSRRKAPIYWLLQSSRKNYAVWLYYPKLNADTLFLALERYVKPKVLLEERRLNELLTARQKIFDNRDATRRADLVIEKQQSLVQEITEFRDKLEKSAKLYLVPDHDDGVVLNIAPLHELVPWKEAGKYWKELLKGKYQWSSIGKQLKEKGIIK